VVSMLVAGGADTALIVDSSSHSTRIN
jgi:hypothetical protein